MKITHFYAVHAKRKKIKKTMSDEQTAAWHGVDDAVVRELMDAGAVIDKELRRIFGDQLAALEKQAEHAKDYHRRLKNQLKAVQRSAGFSAAGELGDEEEGSEEHADQQQQQETGKTRRTRSGSRVPQQQEKKEKKKDKKEEHINNMFAHHAWKAKALVGPYPGDNAMGFVEKIHDRAKHLAPLVNAAPAEGDVAIAQRRKLHDALTAIEMNSEPAGDFGKGYFVKLAGDIATALADPTEGETTKEMERRHRKFDEWNSELSQWIVKSNETLDAASDFLRLKSTARDIRETNERYNNRDVAAVLEEQAVNAARARAARAKSRVPVAQRADTPFDTTPTSAELQRTLNITDDAYQHIKHYQADLKKYDDSIEGLQEEMDSTRDENARQALRAEMQRVMLARAKRQEAHDAKVEEVRRAQQGIEALRAAGGRKAPAPRTKKSQQQQQQQQAAAAASSKETEQLIHDEDSDETDDSS